MINGFHPHLYIQTKNRVKKFISRWMKCALCLIMPLLLHYRRTCHWDLQYTGAAEYIMKWNISKLRQQKCPDYYALALGWVIAWNRPILPPSGYVAPEYVRPALILQSHCSIINHIKTKEKKIASYLLDEVLLQSRCHEFPVEKKNHNWPSQLKELLWTEQRGKERIFITESFRNQLRFVFLQSFIT